MKTLLIASDELKSEAKPLSLKALIHFFFTSKIILIRKR